MERRDLGKIFSRMLPPFCANRRARSLAFKRTKTATEGEAFYSLPILKLRSCCCSPLVRENSTRRRHNSTHSLQARIWVMIPNRRTVSVFFGCHVLEWAAWLASEYRPSLGIARPPAGAGQGPIRKHRRRRVRHGRGSARRCRQLTAWHRPWSPAMRRVPFLEADRRLARARPALRWFRRRSA